MIDILFDDPSFRARGDPQGTCDGGQEKNEIEKNGIMSQAFDTVVCNY